MKKPEDFTTVTVSDEVKRMLFQLRNTMEKDEGRQLSYDYVIMQLIDAKFKRKG